MSLAELDLKVLCKKNNFIGPLNKYVAEGGRKKSEGFSWCSHIFSLQHTQSTFFSFLQFNLLDHMKESIKIRPTCVGLLKNVCVTHSYVLNLSREHSVNQ